MGDPELSARRGLDGEAVVWATVYAVTLGKFKPPDALGRREPPYHLAATSAARAVLDWRAFNDCDDAMTAGRSAADAGVEAP